MGKNAKMATLIASGTLLAGGAGVLGAYAITGASAQAPTKTVTINQGTGAQGETGPQGPPGPPGPAGTGGAEKCPTGSTFGAVVFPQQGQGPTEIWTCIKD